MISKYLRAYRAYQKKKELYKTIENGLSTLQKTGATPQESYFAMRELFVLTSGR